MPTQCACTARLVLPVARPERSGPLSSQYPAAVVAVVCMVCHCASRIGSAAPFNNGPSVSKQNDHCMHSAFTCQPYSDQSSHRHLNACLRACPQLPVPVAGHLQSDVRLAACVLICCSAYLWSQKAVAAHQVSCIGLRQHCGELQLVAS